MKEKGWLSVKKILTSKNWHGDYNFIWVVEIGQFRWKHSAKVIHFGHIHLTSNIENHNLTMGAISGTRNPVRAPGIPYIFCVFRRFFFLLLCFCLNIKKKNNKKPAMIGLVWTYFFYFLSDVSLKESYLWVRW